MTVPQPFLRQNPSAPCAPGCSQGVQIVPVAGNNNRLTPVFVARHGLGHLTADGEVTTTPVHLTYAEAAAASAAHAAPLAVTETREA